MKKSVAVTLELDTIINLHFSEEKTKEKRDKVTFSGCKGPP